MIDKLLSKVGRLVIALIISLFGIVFLMPRSAAQAVEPGYGILGDSNSDEYRADDDRADGTAYEATTLNWAELLAADRSINLGTWGTRATPRRTGYEYNWALSGATTASMVNGGQPAGLATQIDTGDVSTAIIYIGTNDFHIWNDTYEEIYDGTLSDQQVTDKVNAILANLADTVETLQAAGTVNILLANFADPGQTPAFMAAFPVAVQRQRVTDAILDVNDGIDTLATTYDIAVVDVYNFPAEVMTRLDQTGQYIIVGGEAIDVINKGYEPHHLQLGDAMGHPGTVASGLLANFFIGALNSNFGTSIPTFTDAELLENAGIVPGVKTVNIVSRPNNSTQKYTMFDGIYEDSVMTEVTSGRFTYSSGWYTLPTAGYNSSPLRYATSANRVITFTTTATSLDVMTLTAPQGGSMDIYVNNQLKVSFNSYSPTTSFVNVHVPFL